MTVLFGAFVVCLVGSIIMVIRVMMTPEPTPAHNQLWWIPDLWSSFMSVLPTAFLVVMTILLGLLSGFQYILDHTRWIS